jgi:DNA mismatch repair ATPase MutS
MSLIRHPLQEIFSPNYVANDIILNENDKKINVITGANSSGKSVYIKQVFINERYKLDCIDNDNGANR